MQSMWNSAYPNTSYHLMDKSFQVSLNLIFLFRLCASSSNPFPHFICKAKSSLVKSHSRALACEDSKLSDALSTTS